MELGTRMLLQEIDWCCEPSQLASNAKSQVRIVRETGDWMLGNYNAGAVVPTPVQARPVFQLT